MLATKQLPEMEAEEAELLAEHEAALGGLAPQAQYQALMVSLLLARTPDNRVRVVLMQPAACCRVTLLCLEAALRTPAMVEGPSPGQVHATHNFCSKKLCSSTCPLSC